MSAQKRAARRARELAKTAEVLAKQCPTCKTGPGVWCGMNMLGPYMHERRYALVAR